MVATRPTRKSNPPTERPGGGPVRPGDVPPGLVCVGAIAGAHGVRGDLKIKPFTDDPEAVAAYGPVSLKDGRALSLAVTRVQKGLVTARAGGVTSREAAEALKGEALFIAREALPPPEDEDEFYHADLVGLTVEQDGAPFGRVIAVHDHGAGDVLEVKPAGGGRALLIPFTREAVPEVDIKGGRLVFDPPPGLLEDPPAEARGETGTPEQEP